MTTSKSTYVLNYILKHKKLIFILILVLLGLIYLAVFLDKNVLVNEQNQPLYDITTQYTTIIDPTVSLLTVVVTVFLVLLNYNQEAINKLPLTLTAHFKYKGNYVMSCEEAHLGGIHDIRAMGQQIGKQMGFNSNLDLIVQMDLSGPNEIFDGKPRVNYVATFYLSNYPKALEDYFGENSRIYMQWHFEKDELNGYNFLTKIIEGSFREPFIDVKHDERYMVDNSDSNRRVIYRLKNESKITKQENVAEYLEKWPSPKPKANM